MSRSFILILAIACVLDAVAAPTQAGKFNKALSVGDAAPEWKGLIGVDDRRHGLADLKDAKAVVVIFTCNHCPVAEGYEGRFISFTKRYAEKGVAVVALSVSNFPADRLPGMKRRAKARGFNFPYLYDPTQSIGRKYGANCTPQVFLLDAKRRVAYMGAFDDNNDAESVTRPYLRDAVDAVLAGRKPPRTETRQRGCAIEYELK